MVGETEGLCLTRKTESGQREREREREKRGQEEKTIARLTDEETMRHAVATTVLNSRRSSVKVIVVVRPRSLAIVAVSVVCVVVRLGCWPILCLGPGTGPDQRNGPGRRMDCV